MSRARVQIRDLRSVYQKQSLEAADSAVARRAVRVGGTVRGDAGVAVGEVHAGQHHTVSPCAAAQLALQQPLRLPART